LFFDGTAREAGEARDMLSAWAGPLRIVRRPLEGEQRVAIARACEKPDVLFADGPRGTSTRKQPRDGRAPLVLNREVTVSVTHD
jgi:predicted ABC-type transport system involved in lysophospholipase L1 biosynthesis ATPase subunit